MNVQCEQCNETDNLLFSGVIVDDDGYELAQFEEWECQECGHSTHIPIIDDYNPYQWL